jgi:hypothetical protein
MPESRAQVKLAYAVLGGKSDAMPKKVAREITEQTTAQKWAELPEKTRKRK